MKIVIVCPDVPPNPNGGLGTYLEGLIDALSDVDADIHVVGTSRDRKLPSMSLIGNVKIHRVLSPISWLGLGVFALEWCRYARGSEARSAGGCCRGA